DFEPAGAVASLPDAVTAVVGTARGRRTFFGSRSSLRRRNTGARRWSSSVQLWYLTSTTRRGSTHVVGVGRSGFSENGQVFRSSGWSFFWPSEGVLSSRPGPTCDASRSFPSSPAPTSSAPSGARAPSPLVSPPTTKSAVRVGLTFSHASERRPD